jgi:hypothetical protein
VAVSYLVSPCGEMWILQPELTVAVPKTPLLLTMIQGPQLQLLAKDEQVQYKNDPTFRLPTWTMRLWEMH